MTDFSIRSIKSHQDLKLRGKQISPTYSYFLINNALLCHFLANLLAQNKKMTEKSVFREASSPEMTSQSFSVSCFWSLGFVPVLKNRYRIFFLLYLSVHCGDFIEQIKKICHIHFNEILVYSLLFIRQSEFETRCV